MPRIVVVGGGIAGLAAAHRITELDPSVEVEVFEAGDRTGGAIHSEVLGDFVIERGPESILTEKPAAMKLVERIGLAESVIRTQSANRGAYVVCRGKLERIPEGFSLLAPTDLLAFVRSPILSPQGKLRAIAELALPRGDRRDDETLGSFVERRFGRELLDRLAQPMVGGIYGAHPDSLSLGATMPRFLEAEREHRSVILGLAKRVRAQRSQAAQGARYGLFVNFEKGMQMLPDAVAARLDGRIQLGRAVAAIRPEGKGFVVIGTDGRDERADGVVLAMPSHVAARLVSGFDATLASELSGIDFGSAALVTFAFPKERIGRPLDAFGYVTPTIEGRTVIASTWLSTKWPGRAPSTHALLRFFLGRDGDDAIVDAPDAELVAIAREECRAMMATHAEPELVRVDRYARAMPRYRLGHLEKVARIEARVAAHPRFGLAGAAYRGVGIPDAIASGERAAESVLASVRTRA